MAKCDLCELLSACVDAAERAGKVIVKVQKEGNLGIKYKIEDDPVTIADIEAQKVIEATLGVGFEGLPVIGEEVLQQNELETLRRSTSPPDKSLVSKFLMKDQVLPLRTLHTKDIVVWVDPLDGTKCFVDGKYEWVTTLVGIAYKGTPIAGVISYPFTGELLWGAMGIGVFLGKDGERFYPPEKAYNPTQYFRAWEHSLPSKFKHLNADWSAVNTDYKSKYITGAGNVAKNILTGNVHVLLSPLGGKWDTCASEALLRVFGGTITSLKGELLNYHAEASRLNPDGLVATLVNHHRWIPRKKEKYESLSRQGLLARL